MIWEKYKVGEVIYWGSVVLIIIMVIVRLIRGH